MPSITEQCNIGTEPTGPGSPPHEIGIPMSRAIESTTSDKDSLRLSLGGFKMGNNFDYYFYTIPAFH